MDGVPHSQQLAQHVQAFQEHRAQYLQHLQLPQTPRCMQSGFPHHRQLLTTTTLELELLPTPQEIPVQPFH
jgi:hypothetical protein